MLLLPVASRSITSWISWNRKGWVWGNDCVQVERGCHSARIAGTLSRSGGSDYAFTDGSVRLRKYGQDVWLLNLWAVADADRQAFAFQP